jgi:hypothetical protein
MPRRTGYMRRSATAHERCSEQTRCQAAAETRTDGCRKSLKPRADHGAIIPRQSLPSSASALPRATGFRPRWASEMAEPIPGDGRLGPRARCGRPRRRAGAGRHRGLAGNAGGSASEHHVDHARCRPTSVASAARRSPIASWVRPARRPGRRSNGATGRPRLGQSLRPRAGTAEPLPRLNDQTRRARRPRPDRLRRVLDHRATTLVPIRHAIRRLPASRADVPVPRRHPQSRDRAHHLHQRQRHHLGRSPRSRLHPDAEAIHGAPANTRATAELARHHRSRVAITPQASWTTRRHPP